VVAEIGIMIGLYICTQMIDVISRPPERVANAFLFTCAVVTLLITVLLTISLAVRGFSGIQ
jgi:hypothetical protein